MVAADDLGLVVGCVKNKSVRVAIERRADVFANRVVLWGFVEFLDEVGAAAVVEAGVVVSVDEFEGNVGVEVWVEQGEGEVGNPVGAVGHDC